MEKAIGWVLNSQKRIDGVWPDATWGAKGRITGLMAKLIEQKMVFNRFVIYFQSS